MKDRLSMKQKKIADMKYPPGYLLMCINCGTVSRDHVVIKKTLELTEYGGLAAYHKCIACGKQEFIDKDNWISRLEEYPQNIEKRIDNLVEELEQARLELSNLVKHIDIIWGHTSD